MLRTIFASFSFVVHRSSFVVIIIIMISLVRLLVCCLLPWLHTKTNITSNITFQFTCLPSPFILTSRRTSKTKTKTKNRKICKNPYFLGYTYNSEQRSANSRQARPTHMRRMKQGFNFQIFQIHTYLYLRRKCILYSLYLCMS